MRKPNPISAPSVCEQQVTRVLVVDDSRLQRKILTSSLRRWGYHVTEADHGAEALRICADDPPDIVLSDWMMPGMTGLEFCSAFRDMDRESYGYFILLTSKSAKEEIAAGLDTGADDFLTKPVNAPELRARLAAGERILQMQAELNEKNRLIEANMHELQGLYDALDNDLLEAKKLQQSLVSDRYRDFGLAEVSLLLQSCGHVGGDLVGMFPVSETRIGLFGIDVSGHGISSALMTARLAGYLSASAPSQNVALRKSAFGAYDMRPPAETIASLNQLVLEEMETELYFTMLLADVHLDTGQVDIAQAGHPHPVIQRAGGQLEFVGDGGLPVGLIDGASYEQCSLWMRPGDRMLIQSDGIVECANPEGVLLGEEGLTEIMQGLRQTRANACLESIIWKLTDYADDRDFDDDVSAVLLEFKPSPYVG